MKKSKLIILVIALVAFLLPVCVNAEKRDTGENTKKELEYKKETLEEVLTSEGIPYSFEHEDKDDQATIVLFRGAGCSHCHEFLEYVVAKLMPEYGDKIKFEIYEVWSNEANKYLFQDVAEYMGIEPSGVPFIVIGDYYFVGYGEGMNKEITEAIEEEYKNKDKTGTVEKALKYAAEKESREAYEKNAPYNRVIIWTFVFVLASTIVTLTFVNKKYNDLAKKLNNNKEVVEKEQKQLDIETSHKTTKKKIKK